MTDESKLCRHVSVHVYMRTPIEEEVRWCSDCGAIKNHRSIWMEPARAYEKAQKVVDPTQECLLKEPQSAQPSMYEESMPTKMTNSASGDVSDLDILVGKQEPAWKTSVPTKPQSAQKADSITDLKGLGKELWKSQDAQEYVDGLRGEGVQKATFIGMDVKADPNCPPDKAYIAQKAEPPIFNLDGTNWHRPKDDVQKPGDDEVRRLSWDLWSMFSDDLESKDELYYMKRAKALMRNGYRKSPVAVDPGWEKTYRRKAKSWFEEILRKEVLEELIDWHIDFIKKNVLKEGA